MPSRHPAKPTRSAASKPVLLAVGANLQSSVGTPTDTLTKLPAELQNSSLVVRAVSRLFRTRAFPPSSGPDYVNAAIRCDCDLSPVDLMATLHRIEEKFGRTRDQRWGARTLDIDLLAVGDQILPDRSEHEVWRELNLEQQQKRIPDQLILPHPRMQERGFVLVPLADVAPTWVHPILGLSVQDMLKDLPESSLSGISVI